MFYFNPKRRFVYSVSLQANTVNLSLQTEDKNLGHYFLARPCRNSNEKKKKS